MAHKRERRRPDQARQLILEAAEALLREGGVHAVQVRAVARSVGMTDAGVNHHFGSRDQLLEALLRYGGRHMRRAIADVVAEALDCKPDIDELVSTLADVYRHGYAELALSLHLAGWSDDGVGLLDDIVDVLHARAAGRRTRSEVRLAVAALHQAVALEPIFGAAFRRSAGLATDAADSQDQIAWWTTTLSDLIDGPTRRPPST